MSTVDRTQPPKPAPVRPFNFPKVERSTLANQLTLLTANHGQLPLVTLALVAHAGAEHDTRATAGIAYLVVHALEAGTRKRSADRLAWDFELLGAALDVAVTWDAASLALTVPVDKADAALALLAEVITEPAFADAEIERLVGEQLSDLERRRSDPRALASDMASRFIFAPDVPYATPLPGTPDSVRHLSTRQVNQFFAHHWTPQAAALVAVGQIDVAAVTRLVERHLGAWQPGDARKANFDVGTSVERTQVFIVDREASVQSEIRVGHLGLPRSTPDYFAVNVANGVLGGVFTSRLNMSLREEHGFTYGVRSSFGFRKYPGPFLIQTAVESDVTARALDELLKETRHLVQDGATEEETVATREYLAGVMPLEMQTTDQMAEGISDIFVYNLADDYLPQHRAALLAVSRDEANRAARDHIKPDQFAITIVGNAKAIESEIAALNVGPIEVHALEN